MCTSEGGWVTSLHLSAECASAISLAATFTHLPPLWLWKKGWWWTWRTAGAMGEGEGELERRQAMSASTSVKLHRRWWRLIRSARKTNCADWWRTLMTLSTALPSPLARRYGRHDRRMFGLPWPTGHKHAERLPPLVSYDERKWRVTSKSI